MAVTYGFFNSLNGDRKYNAEQMSEYFRGIINEGVYQHLDGGLAVTAGTGLAVNVAAGRAIIQNRWIQNSAAMSLTIAAASETYARKDAVVIRLNWSSRSISIAVKTGTPAASPVAPSMTRNSTTYEMALAYVNVAAGASSVTVTDKRSDSSVCGWASVAQATSGEVDQMLNDMKTGFDGVTYSSPAAMVQGCDQLLSDAIDDAYDVIGAVDDKATGEVTTENLDKSVFVTGLINTNGVQTSTTDTNWKCTDYINIALYRGDNLVFRLDTYNSVNAVSFYKADKTYISGSSVSLTATTLVIPSNATYVRFCSYSGSLSLSDRYVTLPKKKGLNDIISDLEDDVTFDAKVSIDGADFPNNGYINSSGVVPDPTDTNWLNTDFYSVTVGDTIQCYLSGLTGTTVQLACYDSTKTFMSSVSRNDTVSDFVVPNGVTYVRFCIMSERKNACYAIFNTKARGIQNALNSITGADGKRRMIMIGDSYGIQDSDEDITKFYWEYVRDNFGMTEGTDFFHKFLIGAGFGDGEFLSNLVSLASSISDKESITDIIVCGGWNDSDPSQSYGTDEAFNAGILAFNNYVKNTYVNAQVTLAHISWARYTDDAFYTKMNKSLMRYIRACNTYGWRYITNSEYILRNQANTIWQTDGAHPNNSGQQILGMGIVSPLISGCANSQIIIGNITIIGDKKIIFNNDGTITWQTYSS